MARCTRHASDDYVRDKSTVHKNTAWRTGLRALTGSTERPTTRKARDIARVCESQGGDLRNLKVGVSELPHGQPESADCRAQPHDTVVGGPKSRQVSKRLAAVRLVSELLRNRV